MPNLAYHSKCNMVTLNDRSRSMTIEDRNKEVDEGHFPFQLNENIVRSDFREYSNLSVPYRHVLEQERI